MPVVLFVCTANIIRSPIASALFARQLAETGLSGSWQTASAGTWARDGYPAARESQDIMAQMGLDLSRHRSRIVHEGILHGADLILVMEKGHREALWVEFPAHKARIFLLSEMIGLQADVFDPVGGTVDDFLETVRDLQELIDQGFARIIELASKAR
jgi:protein-tyrosine-phosphatase